MNLLSTYWIKLFDFINNLYLLSKEYIASNLPLIYPETLLSSFWDSELNVLIPALLLFPFFIILSDSILNLHMDESRDATHGELLWELIRKGEICNNNNNNKEMDLVYVQAGAGTYYRHLNTSKHSRIERAGFTHLLVYDRNDKLGTTLMGIQGVDNKSMVVVNNDGEWLVGYMIHGTISAEKHDIDPNTNEVVNHRRPVFVNRGWYAFHRTRTSINSDGKPAEYYPGRASLILYRAAQLRLRSITGNETLRMPSETNR